MPVGFDKYTWCAATTLVVLCGCAMGPRALESNRVLYNEAIQRTTAEQLLLNLVRLQYREPPLFLDVTSVSAQFAYSGGTSAGLTVFEGPRPTGPNFLNLGGSVGYEESPTVTFAPLQGEEFVRRLLARLPLESIALLTHSGWRADRVLRLTVQEMNGVDNAARASGPTPERAPEFQRFAEVCRLFQQLSNRNLLDVRVELLEADAPVRVRAEGVDLADTVLALERDYRLARSEDGADLVVQRRSRVPVWRVPEGTEGDKDVVRLRELLTLDPARRDYRFVTGKLARGATQAGEIKIVTRSLMGVLSYLAQAVEVPGDHRERHWVTSTVDAADRPFDWREVLGDLLRIRSQRTVPKDAAVAVRYRGAWFYIDNADLTSKSTMSLLSQLFALQAGEAKAAAPLLTLPLGG